ncbi:hypothetical protein CFC21_110953 [Triticum aestivum]|uniref:Uncharacterized protein n=3 Tax=Triticinae TaxID=1648030 RepID=A0A3B6TQ01_WHEAT|nr:hypothetical protein CFC21_110953 [Triticum aestivum]
MAGEGRPASPLAPAEPQSQQHYDDHVDEKQLDDQQFHELCQRYGPSHLSGRRQRVAAAPAQKTVLEIRYDKGYPEFSDGTSYNGIGVDDATDTASGAETKMSRRMMKKLARAAV